MPKPRIPRRTSEIELWDFNPVGNAAAWRREMLQFWSLVALDGRRARRPDHMAVVDASSGKARHLGTYELADLLANRILAASSGELGTDRWEQVRQWLLEAVIVPGEGKKGEYGHPAGGLAIPHLGAMAVLNRGALRERYWAAFYYSALRSDVQAARAIPGLTLAGELVRKFALAGVTKDPGPGDIAAGWTLDLEQLMRSDPAAYMALLGLQQTADDGLPSIHGGLPAKYFTTAQPSRAGLYEGFLCPGTVVQMRRAVGLLLGGDTPAAGGQAARPVLSDLLETVLANHGAVYFVRGMRVLNDLTAQRRLPPDCSSCWARFQGDVRPATTPAREARLARGEYHGAATRDDVEWIEQHCKAPEIAFVNAGRKELTAAKDLARMSLEDLRRQLSVYTVNRIALSVAKGVADDVAGLRSEDPVPIEKVYVTLDEWSDDPVARGMLASEWVGSLRILVADTAVPESVTTTFDARLKGAGIDPRALEEVSRWIISETLLSSRTFTRYIELLHSLLGGGALPSNQDPKGMLARGGSRAFPFHFSLRERTLEAMVAIASMEADEAGEPMSFQDFLDFLERRYGLLVGRAPSTLPPGAAGLAAEATMQSREALRGRLIDMGLLQEYSDSSEWNRVRWRDGR